MATAVREPGPAKTREAVDKARQGRLNKRHGTQNEHKVMEYLRARGYHCTRSSLSLGAFDVIAVNELRVLFIQVKTTAGPGPSERRAMLAVPRPPWVDLVIWVCLPRNTHRVTLLLPGDIQENFLP